MLTLEDKQESCHKRIGVLSLDLFGLRGRIRNNLFVKEAPTNINTILMINTDKNIYIYTYIYIM